MINEVHSCVDVLQVKLIDQQTNIDRPCELYNVREADGCVCVEEVVGWEGWGRLWLELETRV